MVTKQLAPAPKEKTLKDPARCFYCGRSGEYGIDVIDTDRPDSTGHTALVIACRDTVKCGK